MCHGDNADGSPHPKGILLHRYRGILIREDQSLILQIVKIVKNLVNPEDMKKDTAVVLELVPIQSLIGM